MNNILEEIAATAPGIVPVPATCIQFWNASYTSDNELKTWSISTLKFLELVASLGFCRLDLPSGPTFIRVTDSAIVEEVSKTQMQDCIFDHIRSMPKLLDNKGLYRDTVLDTMLKRIGTLFDDQKLHQVRAERPIQFAKDDRDSRLFFFQNGYVKCTKDRRTFHDYSELQANVWKGEVLPHQYQQNAKGDDSTFAQFMRLVSSGDADRYKELKQITGYLLHQYPDRKSRALVLTDSAISDNGESNGRTGKSLYAKAIGYALTSEPDNSGTIVPVNGKDFDPAYRHKWQEVSARTRIVVLDDVRKNFNPEVLYNDITEGLSVQRKNELPFRQKANIVITTNQTLKLEGESDRDRYVEFEFSNFFSSKRSPSDYFGHWFFSGWDWKEWAKFYALMFECCQLYFTHGLPSPRQVNLGQRKLIDHTAQEFVEWFARTQTMYGRSLEEIEGLDLTMSRHLDNYQDKAKLFDDFTTAYPDWGERGKYKLTRRRFHQWLVAYTRYAPGMAMFDEERDSYHSGNQTLITFRKEKKQ